MIEWETLEVSSRKLEIPREYFYAKTDTIKDRKGKDLTEVEEIKKKWQEYIEELYNKVLHDPDNHDSVITHLEPYILDCDVEWSSGNITDNASDNGIPAELFQILKDDAVKVLHSICQQIWKCQQWPQDTKLSVFIPTSKERQCQRHVQTTAQCTHFTR